MLFEIQYSLSVKLPHTNNIIILIITLDSFFYSHSYLVGFYGRIAVVKYPFFPSYIVWKNNLSFYLRTWWLGIKIIFTDSLCTPSTFWSRRCMQMFCTKRLVLYLSKVPVSPAFSSPSSLMAQCRYNWMSAINKDQEWRRERFLLSE